MQLRFAEKNFYHQQKFIEYKLEGLNSIRNFLLNTNNKKYEPAIMTFDSHKF